MITKVQLVKAWNSGPLFEDRINRWLADNENKRGLVVKKIRYQATPGVDADGFPGIWYSALITYRVEK